VIIHSSPDHFEAAGSEGYCVLNGDASSDPVFLSTGIQRAAGTVLCIGDDATNVNIALAARELNPEQNIISRGTDPSLEDRLIREEKKNRVPSEVRILKWTDDLSTGAANLDKDLKRLYEATEEFQTSVLDNLDKDAVSKRHELLETYAGGHFHRQEIMMSEKGYEGIEEHRLEHEELARLLAGFGKDHHFVIEEEAWNTLDRRLRQHVLDDDRSLTESLKVRDATD
jgi:hemerythrin-like metal-binding protein